MIVKQLIICWAVFIVTFASALNAAEITRDARKHMLRGQAAMEEAKDVADYRDAVTEFKKAIEYAPNWADAWFNLGVAQEKAVNYASAITSFNKYLKLNPKASDRTVIEDRIIKLEYKQEKAQRAKVEKQQSAEKTRKIQQLSGTWQNSRGNNRYRVTVIGNTIEIVHTALYFGGAWRYQDVDRGCSDTWRGTIEGSTLRGSWSRNWACIYRNGRLFTFPMTGTISEDGNTIRLEFTAAGPAGADGDIADGWTEWTDEQILTR